MSARPVVVLTERITEESIVILSRTCDVRIAPSATGPALDAAVVDADAIIVRSTLLGEETIAAARRLRVIGRHGAGVENIDVGAATRRGIPVVNTPGANADCVAEFVIMTMLMALRRVGPIQADFLAGRLSGGSLPGALASTGRIGSSLRGRSVGVVGFGAIGRKVTALCEAFGADVTYFDPFGPFEDRRFRALEDLIASVDVLTLHVPLTEETRGLLDSGRLARARHGLVVVNAARAEVVDLQAMRHALDSHQVATYAADVWHPEPPAPDDPLLNHPAVIATPHMAAITYDAVRAMSASVVEGVLAVLDGREGAAVVNSEVRP